MIGQTVGHYRILSKIGSGGMGEVYLAEDTNLNRRVALKFLPESLRTDDEARERLLREAQAASRLNHPNILTIHAVERIDDHVFIAMEHVEGQSLKQIIGDDGFDMEQFTAIATQVCDGMGAAHEAGLVHRDIKPDNIMVTPKGQVKVMDFGLATWRGASQLTKDGSTVGTMAYMSPEQAQGKEADQRSDLFSLGVVFYEMLTGRKPFSGEHDAAIIYSIVNEQPEPMARFKADIAPALQNLIEKALEKDPEDRYQSAAGLKSDLRRAMKLSDSGSGIRTYQSEVAPPPPKKRALLKVIIPSTAFAVIAFLFLITKPWKLEVQPTQDAAAQQNLLAVMYFDNLADPSDAQRLGKIVTNLLITDLSESNYFRVVSSQHLYDILKRLGVHESKSVDQETATQIATEAKATWMLMGSILQIEPKIVLTAQLVEVKSGNVLASQRISGDDGQAVFSLVDQLTQEIRNDLSLPEEAKTEPNRTVADVTTHSTEAYGYFLDGIEYQNKLYAKEAEESLKKAIEIDSTFAMAYFVLATIEGDPATKQEYIGKAVRHIDHVNNKERLYILAGQAMIKGDMAKSVGILEELVGEYPNEKRAYFYLAVAFRQQKQFERSAKSLAKVIELDPLYKTAYNMMAYDYYDLGQFEKSIGAINKYLEIAPDEANPYDTRGDLYAYNGELDQAIASYKDALRIKPDFAASQQKLGHMYLFRQNYDSATAQYQQLTSSSIASLRGLGRVLLIAVPCHQGKFDQALIVSDRAIAADELEGQTSALPIKYFFKCIILSYLGRTDEAIAAANGVAEVVDSSSGLQLAWTHMARAFVLARNGQTAEAHHEVRELDALDSGSDSASVDNVRHMTRGWVFMAEKKYDQAIAEFRPLADEHDFLCGVQLGQACMDAGRLGEAVEAIENALKRYDTDRIFVPILNVEAYYWLGIAYEKSGWTQKAIAQYEKFLDMWKNADPGIASVADAKARLAKLKTQS